MEDESLLDFLSAPSVLTEDDVVVRAQMQTQDYYIRYGGAAIMLQYTDISASSAILHSQYLEVLNKYITIKLYLQVEITVSSGAYFHLLNVQNQ